MQKSTGNEAAAWIKVAQFLEKDEAVRELCINAEILKSRAQQSSEDDIFATAHGDSCCCRHAE